MEDIVWEQYLNRDLECACGRTHSCPIRHIVIEEGAVLRLPDYIWEGGYKNVCMVTDRNTERAAGNVVSELLYEHGILCDRVSFVEEELIPDEHALGRLLSGIPSECDLLLAVGSGTINDLCKYMSHRLGIDYFVIATAPSMDGYASNVAPLIIQNLKTTYEVGLPRVIIGDVNILAEAPFDLITAGIGDVLGKYVCLADWSLSHIVTGEYRCAYAVGIVRQALETIAEAAEKINGKDRQLVKSVMEGLVLSGIAMSYIGNSRPASGSEHHLSHFWEMMFLQQGVHGAWHGTKVGVGTVVCLLLYRYAMEHVPTENTDQGHFQKEDWEGRIRRVYGPAAEAVIRLENQVEKNSDHAVRERMGSFRIHCDAIGEMVRGLPDAEHMMELLKNMDAPWHPAQLQVDSAMLKNSILYAKEIRNRYGLLQLLYDSGQAEAAADHIVALFEGEYDAEE